MKDRIARSVFWIVWSRGGIQFLSFLSTLLVARLLNPSDYGLMALAGMWTTTVALVAEMGLGAAIIQFRDLDDRELNSCFWLTMGVAGMGYLALYAAAPAIAVWFAAPMLSDVLRAAGLALPLAAIRIVPDSLLRKRLALDKVSKAEIVSVVVTIPVVLGMAWAGAGVWALVAGALIAPLTQSLVTFWFVRWWPGLQVGGRRFREVVRYSLATLGAKISWVLYQQADVFVLGKVSGDVVLGFYTMAMSLATLPVNKVSSAVNQLASPIMAEFQTNQDAMRTSFLRGIRLVASVTFPLCLGLMLVAEDLVRVALTEKWISVVPALQVLCLYAVIRSVDVLLPPVLMARYRAKFLFGYTLSLLGVMPLAFWAGAEWWGAMGVAVVWVAVYPIVMSWMAREALSEVGVSWKMFGSQLWPPMAATLVMVGAMLMVRWVVPSWEVNVEVGRLVVMSLTGAVAYGLTLAGIGEPFIEEIKEIIGWILHGKRVVAADDSMKL